MDEKKNITKKDEKLFRNFSENDIYYRVDDVGWDVYHTHNFYEIMFVLGQTISNCYKDQKITLCKYDMCLIRPEECHKIIQNGRDDVYFVNIEINPQFVENFFGLLDANWYQKFMAHPAGGGLLSIMAEPKPMS